MRKYKDQDNKDWVIVQENVGVNNKDKPSIVYHLAVDPSEPLPAKIVLIAEVINEQ